MQQNQQGAWVPMQGYGNMAPGPVTQQQQQQPSQTPPVILFDTQGVPQQPTARVLRPSPLQGPYWEKESVESQLARVQSSSDELLPSVMTWRREPVRA